MIVLAVAVVAMAALAFTTPANAVIVVPIVDVYGHNEKTNYNGVIDDMFIGSGMNGYGVDGNPGWPAGEGDPSTWTATANGYQNEWQSGDLLDAGESPTNGKIGWTVFDLDSATALLEKLYLWNVRENAGRTVQDYNVYHATTPTVALSHGPTNSTSVDYDFSSGGWTLLNTGGALTLPDNGGTPDPAQAVIDLGGVTAQYIAVEILSNRGDGSRVGLAEVGITAIPEPSTFALSALGLLGLLACGRRRRR